MLNTYDYKEWFTEEESDDKTIKINVEKLMIYLYQKVINK